MVETLSATLAVIVGVATLVIAVSWIAGQERVLGAVREFRSTITLCVSGGAMLGSLYFSEVVQLHPVSVLLVSAHCDVPDCTDWSCGIHSTRCWGPLLCSAYGCDWSVHFGMALPHRVAAGPRYRFVLSDRAIVYRHLVPLIRVSHPAGMALIGFLALIVVNAIPEPVDE